MSFRQKRTKDSKKKAATKKSLKDKIKTLEERLEKVEKEKPTVLKAQLPNVNQIIHFLKTQSCPLISNKDKEMLLKRLDVWVQKGRERAGPERSNIEFRYLPLLQYMLNNPDLWVNTR